MNDSFALFDVSSERTLLQELSHSLSISLGKSYLVAKLQHEFLIHVEECRRLSLTS